MSVWHALRRLRGAETHISIIPRPEIVHSPSIESVTCATTPVPTTSGIAHARHAYERPRAVLPAITLEFRHAYIHTHPSSARVRTRNETEARPHTAPTCGLHPYTRPSEHNSGTVYRGSRSLLATPSWTAHAHDPLLGASYSSPAEPRFAPGDCDVGARQPCPCSCSSPCPRAHGRSEVSTSVTTSPPEGEPQPPPRASRS